MANIYAAVPAALSLLLLAGCESSPLSASASMRIEVEVYKGPLARDPEIQFGELMGLLGESGDAFDTLAQYIAAKCTRLSDWYPDDVFGLNNMAGDLNEAWQIVVPNYVAASAYNRKYIDATPDVAATGPKSRVSRALSESVNRLKGPGTETKGQPPGAITTRDTTQSVQPLRALTQGGSPDDAAKKSEAPKPSKCKGPTQPEKQASGISDQASELRAAIKNLSDDYPAATAGNIPAVRAHLRGILSDVGAASAQLRAKALLWSEAHIAHAMSSPESRALAVTTANLLATYADRLGARADTLIKQVKGDDRRELPLSVALRETMAPAYLRQYIWNDVENRDFLLVAGRDPDHAAKPQGGPGSDEIRARVKAVEKLFVDENWSNINTVHASGQGTVRMALIKDDIGNWNLKSFDQDPSDLLDAYKRTGLAAVNAIGQAVNEAVRPGGGGLDFARQFTGFANQLAGGMTAGANPTIGGQGLPALRQDVATRMTAVGSALPQREKSLKDLLEPAERRLTTAQSERESQLQQVVSLTNSRDDARRQATAARARQATSAPAQPSASAPATGTPASPQPATPVPAAPSSATPPASTADAGSGTPLPDVATAQARLDEAERMLKAAQVELEKRDGVFVDASREVASLKSQLANLSREAMGRVAQILNDHRAIVQALESAVVKARDSATAPAGFRVGAGSAPTQIPRGPQ